MVKCPNCGAPVNGSVGVQTHCPYCDIDVVPVADGQGEPAATTSAAPAAELAKQALGEALQAARGLQASGGQAGGASAAAAATRVVRRTALGCVFSTALVVLAVGGGLLWLFTGVHSIQYWDDSAGHPLPVTIGGHDAFIGVGRGRLHDVVYVVAVNATDVSLLWKAGPLGSYEASLRYTHVAVAGNDVAVTDYRGRLHVYSLATGRPLRKVWLSDRSDGMCPEGDGHSVWVKVVDKRNLRVNLADGTTTPEPDGPAGCMARLGAPREAHVGFDGFTGDHVLRAGGLAVASGVKSPGTPFPEAAGFDPQTMHILWHVTIPAVDLGRVRGSQSDRADHDGLGGGRYVATYRVGRHGLRLTALDVKSGKRLWDVSMPSGDTTDVNGVTVTKARVLVERWMALDVFAANDGSYVGTVGSAR